MPQRFRDPRRNQVTPGYKLQYNAESMKPYYASLRSSCHDMGRVQRVFNTRCTSLSDFRLFSSSRCNSSLRVRTGFALIWGEVDVSGEKCAPTRKASLLSMTT